MPTSRLGPEYNPYHNRSTPVMGMIYIGFVKRNDDAQRMGRLSVWIPEMGGDPKQESSWVVVSYASPFAGASSYTGINSTSQTADGSQTSYGFWAVPPHLDNEVAVFFANGDLARGYYFACTIQQNMNHMIPGVATNTTTDPAGGSQSGPVVEYNKANVQNTGSPPRPRFMPLSDGLNSTGLVGDLERGSSTTSARREAPSQVFGLISPRSNSVHIDDAPGNEFIRLRTRSGTQVQIDETTGFVYINSKNGNAWLEVSDAGVDVYSANSVSFRAQKDFNVRADNNIIFDANQNIEFRAGQQITMQTGTNLQISSGGAVILTAVGNGSIHIQQDLQVKADQNLRFESGADTSLKATGNQNRDGAAINDNGGLSPATTGSDAVVPDGKATLDTTSAKVGSGPFSWKSGGGSINTIVSRMPTHEPWPGHPKSNVPPPPQNDVVPTSGPQGSGNASNVGPNGQLTNDNGCSFGASGTKPISTSSFNAIQTASDQVGVPLSTMLAFGDMESSFQPGVGASSSSAKGLFQFTDSTWQGMVQQYGNQYNISTDPNEVYNANSNATMGAQFIKNNTAALQANGITNPSAGQLYVMHMMGTSGGLQLIQAAQNNPDASAASMFPAAAAANPSIFAGKTVGQVYADRTNLANSKANAYATQQGQPAPCSRAGATPASGTSKSSQAPGANAPTATGAVAAAESVVGQTTSQIDPYLQKGGVSLDANSNNWCAAFVTSSLNQAGIAPVQGNSNIATNWAGGGQPVDTPQSGDVMVLNPNGVPIGSVGGHVGLATGATQVDSNGNLQYQMVQGNYANKVAYTWENASSVTFRRYN